MKKLVLAILGAAFLFASCEKNELYIEQNPYRTIVEYTPGTVTVEVAGTLTPDEDYDWLSVSQSGSSATFTIRRNTTGGYRQAYYTQAGSDFKCVIIQMEHGLDAKSVGSLDNLDTDEGVATLAFTTNSSYPDDYSEWGYIISKTTKMEEGSMHSLGTPVFNASASFDIEDIVEGQNYYVWSYHKSTEDTYAYSDMVAIITVPVYVKAGEDLQAAIDGAYPFSEIRVQGGATFNGPIYMTSANANKSISGGWNADFTAQDINNLSILDGAGKNYGFWCAEKDFTPLTGGYVNISYFKVTGCAGDHGSGVHICGGPVNIHHCLFEGNVFDSKGVVGTREEDYSSELTLYNCIFRDNIAEGGHGACLGFGDGVSYDDYVKATVVNNLFVNNDATKYDGYCSIFICYNYTELIFVNNTVVGNFCYRENGGGLYPGMNYRGNTRNLIANNIFVGNTTSVCVTPPILEPHTQYISLGGSAAVVANNIIEGTIGDSGNMSESGNSYYDAGFDYSSVLDKSSYMPKGDAIGLGSLDTWTIKFRDAGSNTVDIASILDKYNTDLAGNPRVVGGKVDAGCYQAQ